MTMESLDWIDSLDIPDLRQEITEELRHAWSVARDEALLAYWAWCHAGCDEDGAYFAYVAAVDREEAAALHLQRNVQANPIIGMSFPPVPA
jgi:hypothetical protein